MNKNIKSTRTNNTLAHTENNTLRTAGNRALDEKYRDQFTGMALETGRNALNTIRENAGDYKAISEDKSMSPVDKALGKRKVMAADVGLGIGITGGVLGLVWLAKKVFAA